MKKITMIIAGIAVLSAPVAVYASSEKKDYHQDKIERIFEKKDANKDGKLAKEELSGRWSTKFEKLDENKDGFITQAEAKSAHKRMKNERMTNMMMRLDTNSDGEVSEAEFTAFTLTKFKKADKDGNGSLSRDEMSKARHAFGPHKKGHGKGYRHGHDSEDDRKEG